MSTEQEPAARRLDRLYSPPEIGAPGKRRARSERRVLIASGLFVIAMALLALAAFTLVIPGLLGQVYRLHAYFLTAQGLEVGMQVVQEGYVIGLIERVTPVRAETNEHRLYCPAPPAGSLPRSPILPCFRATLRIRDNWPIPLGSVASLASPGLLKGEVIRIQPGSAAELLGEGAIIAAKGPEADLTERLGELTDTLRSVVEETIAPTLASIRDQVKTIELLIGTGADQDENRDRLSGAFENLRELSERLVAVIDPKAIGAILASTEEMSANLAGITKDMTGSTREVQRAVTDYSKLAGDIRALINENRPGLQRSIDDTQLLLQSLVAALTPILTNLEDATRNLAALSSDLRHDPTAILKSRPQEEQAPWFH